MWEYSGFNPVALQLGPLAIHWYGLMYLLGFMAGWWLLRRRAHQAWSPLNAEQVDDVIFYIAMGVILGGRVGYILFYHPEWIPKDLATLFTLFGDGFSREAIFAKLQAVEFWRIWDGGMSFHGGFLGVLCTVFWFARKQGLGFWVVIDRVAPAVPLGLGAGRIGNFINGELWGRVTDVPWAFVVDGVPRHPSQLYEALLEGLVLFVLLWSFSARQRPTMAVSALFLIGYACGRLLVEFVRLPDAHIDYLAFGWLTMGHVLTLPMLVAGILLFWLAYRRPRTVAGTTN